MQCKPQTCHQNTWTADDLMPSFFTKNEMLIKRTDNQLVLDKEIEKEFKKTLEMFDEFAGQLLQIDKTYSTGQSPEQSLDTLTVGANKETGTYDSPRTDAKYPTMYLHDKGVNEDVLSVVYSEKQIKDESQEKFKVHKQQIIVNKDRTTTRLKFGVKDQHVQLTERTQHGDHQLSPYMTRAHYTDEKGQQIDPNKIDQMLTDRGKDGKQQKSAMMNQISKFATRPKAEGERTIKLEDSDDKTQHDDEHIDDADQRLTLRKAKQIQ